MISETCVQKCVQNLSGTLDPLDEAAEAKIMFNVLEDAEIEYYMYHSGLSTKSGLIMC